MYKVRGFVDDQLILDSQMEHIPRVGETVRYGAPDQYAKVTEVIWCLNEQSLLGQRVNLRMETEQAKGTQEAVKVCAMSTWPNPDSQCEDCTCWKKTFPYRTNHVSGGSNPVDFPKFGGCPRQSHLDKDDRCATCTCWKSNVEVDGVDVDCCPKL